MESSTENAVYTPRILELSKGGIPGASLSNPFESHTLPALPWWLLCHKSQFLGGNSK